MHVHMPDGVLEQARQQPSPNQDERPVGCDPRLIVVHGISLPPGQFGTADIDALFCNCLDPDAHPYFAQIENLRVSAHLMIDRAGDITQYVSCAARAWHAGESRYFDSEQCNDFSIGVEMVGTDDQPYRPVQYERLAQLAVALREAYPKIGPHDIVGHCDIAPGRKTDPGEAFNWTRLFRLIDHQ